MDSVIDPTNILHDLLPRPESRDFSCLNRVDFYGDTVFNRAQMSDIEQEIQRLAKTVKSSEERAMLGQIAKLAVRGQETPHLYLKFYGD